MIPMRVAVVSDVHADLPALRTVLAAAEVLGADAVICAGDLVGGGGFPNGVVRLIRETGIAAVRGEHDVAAAPPRERARHLDEWRDPVVAARLGRTAGHLAADSAAFLAALPEEIRFAMGPVRVRVAHRVPGTTGERPTGPVARAAYRRAAAGDDVLVFGGTHRAWVGGADGVLLVNCGSVGAPADGDPRASLAVLTLDGGRVTARIHRAGHPGGEPPVCVTPGDRLAAGSARG
jgi:putative phosphoesterase